MSAINFLPIPHIPSYQPITPFKATHSVKSRGRPSELGTQWYVAISKKMRETARTQTQEALSNRRHGSLLAERLLLRRRSSWGIYSVLLRFQPVLCIVESNSIVCRASWLGPEISLSDSGNTEKCTKWFLRVNGAHSGPNSPNQGIIRPILANAYIHSSIATDISTRKTDGKYILHDFYPLT
jgi:hypothetical protein